MRALSFSSRLLLLGAAATFGSISRPHLHAQVRTIDFADPTYGGQVRQIYNPAGDEHDLYHYRSVFNADNSRLLGIETPAGSKDYLATLYDGDGTLLRRLYRRPAGRPDPSGNADFTFAEK
jgi:hypothetical protein